jgi:hypothetical protein
MYFLFTNNNCCWLILFSGRWCVPPTVSALQTLQRNGPIYGCISKFQHMLGLREVPSVTMNVDKSVLSGANLKDHAGLMQQLLLSFIYHLLTKLQYVKTIVNRLRT